MNKKLYGGQKKGYIGQTCYLLKCVTQNYNSKGLWERDFFRIDSWNMTAYIDTYLSDREQIECACSVKRIFSQILSMYFAITSTEWQRMWPHSYLGSFKNLYVSEVGTMWGIWKTRSFNTERNITKVRLLSWYRRNKRHVFKISTCKWEGEVIVLN